VTIQINQFENKTTENWKGQGTPKVSQPKKSSAKSYLHTLTSSQLLSM